MEYYTTAHFEELASNAFPAIQKTLFDGWVLQFSTGRGGNRPNSILPLYPSILPIEDKLAACEEIYRRRGQLPVYKMTEDAPSGLDAMLEEKGYKLHNYTTFMTLPVKSPYPIDPVVQVEEGVSYPWLNAFYTLTGLKGEEERATAAAIRCGIAGPAYCALVMHEGAPIACGLCVVERRHAGLFDIYVRIDQRRKGIAKALVQALLESARGAGARTAYLQAMATNVPAIDLYKGLGFTRLYDYWYRLHPML